MGLIIDALKIDQPEQSRAAWNEAFDLVFRSFKRYSERYPAAMEINQDASFEADSSLIVGAFGFNRRLDFSEDDLNFVTEQKI